MDLNTILKNIKIKNSDTCFWQYSGNPTTEEEYQSSIIFYNSDGNVIEVPTIYNWSQVENGKVDVALQNLRDKRNRLLAETDYLALSDQTMSSEMTTYRQALRDITNGLTTVEDVEAVTWPTKP
tara:strand:- start:293 stop:664 length:372 start_codon:yes stop_codon:yes gene_type:complete